MRTSLDILRTSADQVGAWSARLRVGHMFGVRGWWSVIPNQGEVVRRQGARASALRRLAVVDVLLGLPVNLPVPEGSLSSRERRVLAGLPPCVIERSDGAIVRRACPPLRVDHVVVPARAFRTGLEAASSFAAYCSRSMVLGPAIQHTEMDLAEASYYGVGVYAADDDGLVELVAPETMPNWDETPASWVFSEALFEQFAPLE